MRDEQRNQCRVTAESADGTNGTITINSTRHLLGLKCQRRGFDLPWQRHRDVAVDGARRSVQLPPASSSQSGYGPRKGDRRESCVHPRVCTWPQCLFAASWTTGQHAPGRQDESGQWPPREAAEAATSSSRGRRARNDNRAPPTSPAPAIASPPSRRLQEVAADATRQDRQRVATSVPIARTASRQQVERDHEEIKWFLQRQSTR